MSIICNFKSSLIGVVCVVVFTSYVNAQILPSGTSPQIQSQATELPVLPPRSLETREMPLRQERSDFDRPPTSSFIDSIKGNDASIAVVYGQSRLITTKKPIASSDGVAVIGVADPTVVDFDVLGPQLIRIVGNRIGVTDLSFVTADGETFAYQINVGYDLQLVEAQLKQLFPDALILFAIRKLHFLMQRDDARARVYLEDKQPNDPVRIVGVTVDVLDKGYPVQPRLNDVGVVDQAGGVAAVGVGVEASNRGDICIR